MRSKVLVFGEYGALNGGENSLLTILPRLVESGFEFHAAVPRESEFAAALHGVGVVVHELALFDANQQRKSQAEIRTHIADLISHVAPDLMHCNSLSTSRLCGPVAADRKIASLGYLRDILKLSRKATADINQLRRIIAVSQATQDFHVGRGLDASKTFVVHNGVDSDRFHPPPDRNLLSPSCRHIRRGLGIPETATIVLFVGQIGLRKGLDVLLDSFFKIAQDVPAAHLLIVGQRHSQKAEAVDYENDLIRKSQEFHGANRIHWLGRRNDIPELMRAASVLIHPARQEPLGRVLLEAAASGLPIVTTRVGGSPEIFSDRERRRWLVEVDDVAGLAHRATQLLTQPATWNELSSQLRKLAIERFSVSRCADAITSHYRELLPQ